MGKEYEYRIIAGNNKGWSNTSTSVIGKTKRPLGYASFGLTRSLYTNIGYRYNNLFSFSLIGHFVFLPPDSLFYDERYSNTEVMISGYAQISPLYHSHTSVLFDNLFHEFYFSVGGTILFGESRNFGFISRIGYNTGIINIGIGVDLTIITSSFFDVMLGFNFYIGF